MSNTMRVLVVDDMTSTRDLMVEELRSLGVEHLNTASSAAEAWTHLERGATDLVISDLHMPGLDGIELYRRMKRDDRMARTQFVLATSDGALANLPDGYRLGGHRMLRKPYTAEALADCLDDAARRIAGTAT